MPSAAVTLNSVLLDPQPTEVEVIPAQGIFDEMEDGSFMGSSNAHGAIIKLTWGPKYALNAVLPMLVAARAGTDICPLTLTDINGTAYSFSVLWLENPSFKMVPSWSFEPITITLRDSGG